MIFQNFQDAEIMKTIGELVRETIDLSDRNLDETLFQIVRVICFPRRFQSI